MAKPAGLDTRPSQPRSEIGFAGLTNAEIAARKLVSRGTVKTHPLHIYAFGAVRDQAPGVVRLGSKRQPSVARDAARRH
jgi:hypothetical protein